MVCPYAQTIGQDRLPGGQPKLQGRFAYRLGGTPNDSEVSVKPVVIQFYPASLF